MPNHKKQILQKRLAADILGVGKRKIWLDPNEKTQLEQATSRSQVRKLIRDGLIIAKPVVGESRAEIRKYQEARKKGRHSGAGKRFGTAEARMPTKTLWIRRQRTLRAVLFKYREEGKIDKKVHRNLYMLAKGNTFKHKRALIEHIATAQAQAEREKHLRAEAEARRARIRAAREQEEQRMDEKHHAQQVE